MTKASVSANTGMKTLIEGGGYNIAGRQGEPAPIGLL